MSWKAVSDRANFFFDPATCNVTYAVYETRISRSFGFSDYLKKINPL